tara:strand:- start:1015 stop:1947 length:933 start_codon:yes stop_codon:yes gene_type:complete
MIKVFRHPEYYYELESATRFADVQYVDNMDSADYIAIASSHNKPVFKGLTKPVLYSYIREHPYTHDQYLQTQFDSLNPSLNVKIYSISSFDKFAPNKENIIFDNFELDCYKRLFVDKECEVIGSNLSSPQFLFLGGKPEKANRKPLLDLLLSNPTIKNKLTWSMFGVNESPDKIERDSNHYLGYPYDPMLYKMTNISIIAETHYSDNQEFHPTEKIYRAIANMHPFIVASTPYFLTKLHQKGYKTFNTLFDEFYDMEKNHSKRLLTLVSAIKQICNSDLLWGDFKNICTHNLNTLKENSLNTRKRIIESL